MLRVGRDPAFDGKGSSQWTFAVRKGQEDGFGKGMKEDSRLPKRRGVSDDKTAAAMTVVRLNDSRLLKVIVGEGDRIIVWMGI